MHACMHTLHTYIHTYIHYIHTYIQTYIHYITLHYKHYIHTYHYITLQTLHTYIPYHTIPYHTYIYIYTYIYICILYPITISPREITPFPEWWTVFEQPVIDLGPMPCHFRPRRRPHLPGVPLVAKLDQRSSVSTWNSKKSFFLGSGDLGKCWPREVIT